MLRRASADSSDAFAARSGRWQFLPHVRTGAAIMIHAAPTADVDTILYELHPTNRFER